MDERLAACTDEDVATLSSTIRELLWEDDDAVVPQVMQHVATRPAATRYAVAAALLAEEDAGPSCSEDGREENDVAAMRHRALLGGLLQQVKQHVEAEIGEEAQGEVSNAAALRGLLVAYASRLRRELTKDQSVDRLRMYALWADAVVEMAAVMPAEAQVDEAGEGGGESAMNAWIVQLASEFFAIHQHSTAIPRDFRIMTIVWKNLNKLSTVFRSTLLRLCGDSSSTDPPEAPTLLALSIMFDAVATSLAQTTQRLRTQCVDQGDQDIAQDLKLLRLFLRAFQGQFVQFVDTLVAQVECSVALAVDAIAAVIPIAEGLLATSEQTQHEAFRVLQCAVTFVETTAKSDKLQASTRSFVGTLLWQPCNQFDHLVKQTRSQFVDSSAAEANAGERALSWAHTISSAAFFAVHGVFEGSSSPDLDVAHHTSMAEADPVFGSVAALLTRYRHWSKSVQVGEFPKSLNLFVDIVLDSLVAQADSIRTLQCFLLEQTLHPDPAQRFVMYEIWREFMCNIWEDDIVVKVFTTLVEMMYTKNAKGIALDVRVRSEVLELIAYLYPEICGPAKHQCLLIVSSAFDVMCSEGPGHKVTPQLISSLDLLDLLASTSLVVEYDQPDKEDWVAHYLPMTLECIGGVHDLLERGDLVTSAERDGIIRVLDTCLLIVRAIFEDNTEDDVQGISKMLLPMCTETITHLAKLSVAANGETSKPSLTLSPSFSRVLRSCLFILTRISPLIKVNHTNQCIQLVKDLVTILQSDHELTPHAVAVAVFVRDGLGDVCVAPVDADIAWKLFARLFHKLSALHFGLQVNPVSEGLTAPQSVCLEALHVLFVKSNLPNFANRKRSVKDWIVPHAQPRFATFLQMMCEGLPAAKRARTENAERWNHFKMFETMLASRFARHPVSSTNKRQRDQPATAPTELDVSPPHEVSCDDYDMDEEIANAKRVKWDSFATTYWQLHDNLSSLSSPSLQEAFLDRLSEKDLDQATTALQNLLQKNQS